MADGAQPSGVAWTAATDERTIGGSTQHVQRTTDTGATTFATNQVSIPTTAGGTEVVAARDTRKSVLIINMGTQTVYIGTTTTGGFPLAPGQAIRIDTVAQVKAISGSGTQTVAYLETYDT